MARIKVVLGERKRVVKEAKARICKLYAIEKKQKALQDKLAKMRVEQEATQITE